MSNMFCFQCEQTAGGKGCKVIGVCGKRYDTALLQDKLTGALIGLSNAAKHTVPNVEISQMVMEGLFSTITNVNFDNKALEQQIKKIEEAKKSCSDSHTNPESYDMGQLWNANEDVRSLKSLILFGLRGMAAYAYHALVLGYRDEEINRFLLEGLSIISEDLPLDKLLEWALKTGEVNLKCMALLDKANTKTYGTPTPVTVPLKIEKGPFIIVSGHNLRDLQLLLEQTKGKGINIYTHGEMLPAHAYPKLKAYAHLKGNFGTAWQNQQKEFQRVPASILFTTNCLMPVRSSYDDRVFTTSAVSYPGLTHIGEDKNFAPVIQRAIELGGYSKDQQRTGPNGGEAVSTGFARGTVFSLIDPIAAAVKSGAVRHLFVVGGCDGAKPGRNYYTEFVKQTPKESIIFTLACGKYRFHDLDLGKIGDLPRMMDMGQYNDVYSAIQVAKALAEKLHCEINELPLTFVLSWYEQKAVCILLSLLALGIQNIHLGPTMPAFLSPNTALLLREKFHLIPASLPEKDLKEILT